MGVLLFSLGDELEVSPTLTVFVSSIVFWEDGGLVYETMVLTADYFKVLYEFRATDEVTSTTHHNFVVNAIKRWDTEAHPILADYIKKQIVKG